METPSHFSFGVNEKKNKESDKFVGYSIPVCLWEKESDPTPEEKRFFSFNEKHYKNLSNSSLK